MNILKTDSKAHEITFIVYRCGVPDLQGDIIKDPEVLRKAAHNFMEKYRKNEITFDIDHDGKPLKGVVVRESYFTESETIKNEITIPKHCWIMNVKIPNKLWPMLKGTVGVSMKGRGKGEDYEDN